MHPRKFSGRDLVESLGFNLLAELGRGKFDTPATTCTAVEVRGWGALRSPARAPTSSNSTSASPAQTERQALQSVLRES